MTDTGTRTGITYLQNDGADAYTLYRTSIRNIVSALEAKGALAYQTVLGSRPAAGAGLRFWKDSGSLGDGVLYFDNGSTWEAIGTAATVDGAAGVASLRTLGTGATQAAAGNHTHSVAAIGGLDSYLEPWLRPGGLIDESARGGSRTSCPVGTTLVVAVPGSGRRVVKNLFVTAAAGATISLDLNGVVFYKRTYSSAGFANLDVTFPLLPSDSTGVRAIVTGATCTVTPTYGDRTDTLVERHGLLSSSSASGTLVAASTGRTVNHLWVYNAGSANATFAVSLGGVLHFPTTTLTPGGFLSHESPLRISSSEAVTFVGDATNALTYIAAGR